MNELVGPLKHDDDEHEWFHFPGTELFICFNCKEFASNARFATQQDHRAPFSCEWKPPDLSKWES